MTQPDTRKNPNSTQQDTAHQPHHELNHNSELAEDGQCVAEHAAIVTVTPYPVHTDSQDNSAVRHTSGIGALPVPLHRSPPMNAALRSEIAAWLDYHRPAIVSRNRRKATIAKKSAAEAARRSGDKRFRPEGLVAWPALNSRTKQARRLEAMKAAGQCFAITLLLSPAKIARAEREERPLEWLAARISTALKKGLGRPVDIILFDQHNKAEKLHLHGVIGISEEEKPHVTQLLRKSLGVFKDIDTQIRFEERDPDEGWLGYILDRQDHRHSSYSTHSVTARARALHAGKRKELPVRPLRASLSWRYSGEASVRH